MITKLAEQSTADVDIRGQLGGPAVGLSGGHQQKVLLVIGGASLAGGVGSMGGAFVGLPIIKVLNNGMSLLHINPNLQPVVVGAVMLAAILGDHTSIRLRGKPKGGRSGGVRCCDHLARCPVPRGVPRDGPRSFASPHPRRQRHPRPSPGRRPECLDYIYVCIA